VERQSAHVAVVDALVGGGVPEVHVLAADVLVGGDPGVDALVGGEPEVDAPAVGIPTVDAPAVDAKNDDIVKTGMTTCWNGVAAAVYILVGHGGSHSHRFDCGNRARDSRDGHTERNLEEKVVRRESAEGWVLAIQGYDLHQMLLALPKSSANSAVKQNIEETENREMAEHLGTFQKNEPTETVEVPLGSIFGDVLHCLRCRHWGLT
jgi:hypothetical protein